MSRPRNFKLFNTETFMPFDLKTIKLVLVKHENFILWDYRM